MAEPLYRVTVRRQEGRIGFLVIAFDGEINRRIEESVRAEYGINGEHRRLEPYRVEGDWEVIYARRN